MRLIGTGVGRLIAVGLGAALLSFGADRGLVGLVGADAQVIAGVQMDQVRGTALGQYLLKQAPATDANFQKFMQESGFDPRRDLRELVVAKDGKQGSELAIIRGTFDMAKIAALAKRDGATMTKYQGYDVISNGENHWVGFAENTIAVMGPAAAVKAALARRQSGPGLDKTTLDRIDRVSGANDAWFVASPPTGTIANRQAQGNPAVQAFHAVQQASGGVRLGSVVEVNVEAIAKSDKDAAAMADVVRMFAAMGAGQTAGPNKDPQFQTFAALLDKVQVQTSGTTVKMMLPIPQSQVEQWIQDAQKPRGIVRKTSVR